MTRGSALRDPFPFLDSDTDVDGPPSPCRRYAEGLQLWLAANARRLDAADPAGFADAAGPAAARCARSAA